MRVPAYAPASSAPPRVPRPTAPRCGPRARPMSVAWPAPAAVAAGRSGPAQPMQALERLAGANAEAVTHEQQQQCMAAAEAAAGLGRRSVLRAVAAVVAVVSMAHAAGPAGMLPSAEASAIGDTLRGVLLSAQRKDGGAKLLAPFNTAKVRLTVAADALDSLPNGGGGERSAAVREALQSVRASSLNCYLFEPFEEDSTDTRASLLTQQLKLADPCTFRIIARNVLKFGSGATLENGLAMVEGIERSYTLLDGALLVAMQESSTDADVRHARELLAETTRQVTALEGVIRETLTV